MLTSHSDDFVMEHVAARVHGRILLRRGSGGRTLVGFHGYAENAQIHLGELVKIPGLGEWTLVSVQALHPFYTRTQDVVANWMTREDRELAILDNVAYVVEVVRSLECRKPPAFIGFSQGASMAWRAASAVEASAVVALGGDIPPDVKDSTRQVLPRALIARGIRDEFFTHEKLEQDLSFLRSSGDAESLVFDGGHEWTDEFRPVAGQFLTRD